MSDRQASEMQPESRGPKANRHNLSDLQEKKWNKMDCVEDEYLINGKCQKCLQCPPGQELKEDCGYGVGVSAVCGVCERRWFKADWSSQPCRMCQNCRRLNREEVTPCAQTHNAVCGDCLPGFYNKRRVDGLQDLECLPCGRVQFRNVQCRNDEKDTFMENVWSSEAPPLSASVMTTCVAAVTTVTFLFVIAVLMYQGFGSLKKLLRGCLSVSRSYSDPASISVAVTTEHTVTQEGEGASELYQPYPCLVSMPTTSNPSPHVCESPPPLHNSICSNLTSGVITLATGSRYMPPASDNPLPLASTEALADGGRSCAGVQEEGWGCHAPVECTELDFLNLPFPPNLWGSTWPTGLRPLPSQSTSSLALTPASAPGGDPDLLELGRVEQEETQEERGGGREERENDRNSCTAHLLASSVTLVMSIIQ